MQQQQNNNISKTSAEETKKVHIKAQNGNEMRRFSIVSGSYDYASLVQHIRRLFNFNVESNIELKYKDDEGDMIIISSDEELKFAIELFSETKTLLRLSVGIINISKESAIVSCGKGWKRGCGRKEWKKRCSWTEGHGHELRGSHGGCGKWKEVHVGFKINKLVKKREELSRKLKEFGAPAPRLEAKIAWIDSKIAKLSKETDSKQDNAQHPFNHQHPFYHQRHHSFHQHHPHSFRRSESESSSEGPKWGRRGCGQWKTEHLNFKIEKLTQKRNFLSEKLKSSGAPAPHLEAKIACLDAWIIKLKGFASAVSQENFQHHPHPFHQFHHHQPHHHTHPVPPFVKMCNKSESSESSESSEGKCGRRRRCGGRRGGEGKWAKWASDPICMQMWSLRKEKKQLKRLVQEGPESVNAANIERINAINNELTQLRLKKFAQNK